MGGLKIFWGFKNKHTKIIHLSNLFTFFDNKCFAQNEFRKLLTTGFS